MTTKKPARPSVARSKGAQVKKPALQAGTVRVAAIQMASGPNVASNLAEAEQLIETLCRTFEKQKEYLVARWPQSHDSREVIGAARAKSERSEP